MASRFEAAGTPRRVDIHGIGTNVPGYGVSWNCYDRLISHEMKSGPGGVPYYDRDKFKGEFAAIPWPGSVAQRG